MKMEITVKRVVRLVLGGILPVPLFVGFYYFSYFYTSYHGFDHETGTYLTDAHDLEIARQHLKTDALAFLAAGYLLMGIPSLVYSFLLERHRGRLSFGLSSHVGCGAMMGGISGLIAACGSFVLTGGLYDAVLVVVTASGVGGMIALSLFLVFRGQANRRDGEHGAVEEGPSRVMPHL